MSRIYNEVGINYNKGKRKRYSVAPGCTFEPDDADYGEDIIRGTTKKKVTISVPKVDNRPYRRDDGHDKFINDSNFAERILSRSEYIRKKKSDEVNTPDDFVVTVAYNKGGYQVIPKEDL